MAYVKISDQSIVDLSTIQQIINVINDHSDYLNVLVNKFGANYVPDWLQDDVQSNFDLSRNNIVFGKAKITPSTFTTYNNKKYYYAQASFQTGVSFAEPPIVIVSHDNSDGVQGGQLDIAVSTHGITTTGFTARAHRVGTDPNITNNIILNYIAIGEK